MYAGGISLKGVAKALNGEQVSPPRPRAGKKYATWCPSGIREMLRRELYAGRVIWNQSRFVKVPGTNRRVRRERPQSEWRIVERPELRIIPVDLWEKVQERVKAVGQMFGNNGRAGLLARSATSPYFAYWFPQVRTVRGQPGDCDRPRPWPKIEIRLPTKFLPWGVPQ